MLVIFTSGVTFKLGVVMLEQEFMRPGWEADDGWRMVTNEFMATAQLFTAHLAHAEYRRQKELARKRGKALGGADAITIPVARQLSKEGRRKKQAELQKQGIKTLKAEEEEEENPWAGTQLAGLMTSMRQRERLQPDKVVGRSNTTDHPYPRRVQTTESVG